MDQSKKAQVEKLSGLIESGIVNLRSSNDYKEFLKMMSKLPAYSYRNCMLIALQTEGKATMVMGYKAWETNFDRHVKAGSKGIRILAPNFWKRQKEVEVTDEDGKPVCTENGDIKKMNVEEVIPSFRVISVFDVADTEGKDLPSGIVHRLEGNSYEDKELIDDLISASPVPISFKEIPGEANGVYHLDSKSIDIEAALSDRHKIHTIIHEMGHATLDLNGADTGKTRNMKEVEAESISFVVMNYLLGDRVTPDDIGQYSFGYIDGYSTSGTTDEDRLSELKEALPIIQKTSLELISKVEAVRTARLEEMESKVQVCTGAGALDNVKTLAEAQKRSPVRGMHL